MKSLILFLVLFSTNALATETDPVLFGEVTGTVMDQQFEEPIPYATISVTNEKGEIVEGTVSAVDGTFILEELPRGTYLLQVQFMGYKTFSKEVVISQSSKSFDLGAIYLSAEVAELEGVEVIAERSTIEQRIDRKVVNVGKDLTTVGATAAEIMNNIPSVSVDQDGNVSLRGNSGVRILVDGKPTNMDASTLLKTIPSSSIKKIELITNPSAKYDPEGMSGIINIILHKNSNLGFNGNFAGGLTAGEKIRSNASLNMNYREGKFNFYTNLGINAGENIFKGYIRDVTSGATEYPDMVFGRTSYLVKAGTDFYLNDRNTFSFYTNQRLTDENGDGNFDLVYPEDPSRNYSQIIDMEEENTSSNYNFVYLHDFVKEGHDIQLELDHNRYENVEDSFFDFVGNNPPATSYQEFVNRIEQTTLANLDYVNPLNDHTKIELGTEARIRRVENLYNSEQAELSEVFYTYDRDIYSLYATFGQQYEKWQYQVGSRFENYQVNAVQDGSNIYDDEYFTAYPSAFLSYTPGGKSSYQVSYSRRVDRPSLGQVNPVRQVSTPRITAVGNPALEPQFTNSYEFNYTRKMGKSRLSGSLFYRLTTDKIDQIFRIDPQNPEHLVVTFDNSGDSESYGVELSGSFEPASFWTLNTDFNLYGQNLSGYVGTTFVETQNTYYRFQANNSFKVNNRLKLQLFGMYQGPFQTLQLDLSEMYFVNLGGRYSFWNDKASLSVNLNDIFNTQYRQFESALPTPQEGELRGDSRSVYFGFTYRFGGSKSQALERKKRDDNTAQGGMF